MKIPKRLSNIILAVIAVNFVVLFSLGIQPAKSLSENLTIVTFLNFIFFGGVIFIGVLSYCFFKFLFTRHAFVSRIKNIKHVNIDNYAASIFFITLMGFALLLYDRIYLRGVDYALGIRSARYMWVESSGGNIAGIVGNILNSFGYLALFRVINAWGDWSKMNKLLFSLSIFFSVIGLSVLNGGRANILYSIFILISIVILSLRKYIFSIGLAVRFRLIIYGLIFTLPIVVVTESSAELGGYSPIEHYIDDISALYGYIEGAAPDFGFANEFIYRLNYMIVYLFHGLWTFQVAVDLPPQEPFYTLYPVKAFLAQFGVVDAVKITGYFSDTGAFISLPGALFYDYGLLGLMWGSIILGIFLGHAVFLYRKNMGAMAYAYSVIIVLVVIMSPFCVPYGFSVFFISLIPFFFVDFFGHIVGKKFVFNF